LSDETPEEILRLGGQPSARRSQHPSTAPTPGVKAGTLPGTFRRAGQSTQEVANMLGELVAEGGRFELRGRPTTKTPTSARKSLRHKGCRCVSRRALMARKNPKEPAKPRPEMKRFTSRRRPGCQPCFRTQTSNVPPSARKGT